MVSGNNGGITRLSRPYLTITRLSCWARQAGMMVSGNNEGVTRLSRPYQNGLEMEML